MFGPKIDSNERRKVLELLGRWSHSVASIDGSTDAMRQAIAVQPLGMQSDEFEKARLAAVAVVGQIQKETTDHLFWPILEDNRGGKILLELQMKLNESYAHQLNLLNLYKIAANAFRSGKDAEAPSAKEIMSANKSFARVLDQMGAIAGKLARHYGISAQEYQREL